METISVFWKNLLKTQSIFSSEEMATFLSLLESGKIRCAEYNAEQKKWIVHSWVKEGILRIFKSTNNQKLQQYGGQNIFFDKIKLLNQPTDATPSFRISPYSWVRRGVFLGENSVVLYGAVNIGAYIGEKTMIDMNASIGSCAQIGKRCHISANAVVGGVLEPSHALPVIINDDVFIGANSSVSEGFIIEDRCIIGAGVVLAKSTSIYDTTINSWLEKGILPAGSVVVGGNKAINGVEGVTTYCAVIIRKLKEDETHHTCHINDLLRN